MSNAVHALLIGRTLAEKYVIESLIGCGGMGAVYRARQVALDKWVAVKVLHREMEGEPKYLARFEREALSSSRLDHPNSLRVLDFGSDAGLSYLVMEYVEAEDLLAVMNREWPLSDERVVNILSQVLAALAVAHDMGIVHRDLKPENILVLAGADDDGLPVDVVKVCDFGIAKMANVTRKSGAFEPSLTVDGLAIGTPDYMSPEQARGEPVDGRSDLYSVGVVLYHLLAGRTPFTGDSPLGVALQHVADEPRPPSRFRDVDPNLEAICLHALEKRPDDRFQTAREMRRALRSALDGSATRSSNSMPPLVISRPLHARRQSSFPTEPTGTREPRERSTLGARFAQAMTAIGVGAIAAFAVSTAIAPIRRTLQDRLGVRYEAAQTVATTLVQDGRLDTPRDPDPRDLELWPLPPERPSNAADAPSADAGPPPADSAPIPARPHSGVAKANLTVAPK
jgi:serine/threonine-protein kinase